MWLSNNRKTNNNQLKQTTMKKYFMYAVAAVAAMSLTSCLSEDEVNLEKGNMGTINVSIEADNSLATRASVATVTDWYAFVDGEDTDNDFGTGETHLKMTDLATKKFPYGTYSVTVSNFANMAAAHKTNSNLGAAYYEGTQTGVVVKANAATDVTINCGKAKNVKFDVTQTGFDGNETTGLYFTNVVITSNDKEAARITGTDDTNFSALTTSTSAFFQAGTKLGYTINWKKDGINKHYNGEITLAGPGSQNYLSLAINADGTITIANTTGITYDETWTDGTTQTITVNAETGEKI